MRKAWSYADIPVEVGIQKNRMAVTLFGAIGNALQQPCLAIEESTNKDAFLRFLKQMKASLRYDVVKPFLVMDNH